MSDAPLQCLVADDNPLVRAALRGALVRAGHQVREASSGVEALAACTAAMPDVLLAAAWLPDLDCGDLVSRARALPGSARLRCVATSGRPDEQQLARLADARPDAILVKPFHPETLAQALALVGRGPGGTAGLLEAPLLPAMIFCLQCISERLASLSPAEIEAPEEVIRWVDFCGLAGGALFLAGEGGRLSLAAQSRSASVPALNALVASGALEPGPGPARRPPELPPAALHALGVPYALPVPVLGRGERLGVLLLLSRRPQILEREGESLAQTLAAQLGQGMIAARSLRGLQQSEGRYRLLFEGAAAGLLLVDADGRVLEGNPLAAAFFDCAQDALVGRPLSDLLGVGIQVKGAPGESVLAKVKLRRADGREAWVDVTFSALVLDGRQLSMVALNDSTGRLLVQRALQTRARQQEAILKLGSGALAGLAPALLLERAAEVVAETLGLDLVQVLERTDEALRVGACAGAVASAGVVGIVVPLSDAYLTGYALARGYVTTADIGSETRFGFAPHVAALGLASGVAVVIRGPQRPAGVLTAFSRSPRTISPDERRFLETVAILLGDAIERKRVEEALRAQTLVLQSIFDTLPAGVLVADLEGTPGMWNRAAVELLQPRASDAPGLPPVLCDVGGAPLPLERTPLLRATRGTVIEQELCVLRDPQGGKDRWLSISACPLTDEQGKTSGGLAVFVDLTAEHDAHEALRRAQADFRRVIDHDPTGLAVVRAGRVLYANPALAQGLGRETTGLQGVRLSELLGAGVMSKLSATPHEATLQAASGGPLVLELSLATLDEFEGGPAQLLAARDVTARRRLEEQLRQSHKMDAVGQLAGGIAHDFNNIIGSLLVNAQLVLELMPADHEFRADVEEMRKAGERAAALTQQLLAFGRRQVLQPRVLELNAFVREIEPLLRRMMGGRLEVTAELAPGEFPVKADPGQLEQVMLNIALNARDAMPGGGRLSLRTRPGAPPGEPGSFVCLSLTDTGAGMDAATQARAFEPFFTTKEKTKGAGLGLSTAYGIVQQSGGKVLLESAPGQGTTVSVFLPLTVEQGKDVRIPTPTRVRPAGAPQPTVLVVEDDVALRSAVHRTLSAGGFAVLVAGDATEARAAAAKGRVDLLLTDMVLPGPGGPEIAELVVALHPSARVLFMSGYSEHPLLHGGKDLSAIFLQKPFTPQALLRKVEGILEEPR